MEACKTAENPSLLGKRETTLVEVDLKKSLHTGATFF
jgi:hypothetical protein